jgi:hypothetical protein
MLNDYLYRLYDTIVSRGYLEVEQLAFENHAHQHGSIRGQLRFPDGSLLDFGEVLIVRRQQVVKLRYAYHYQTGA